MNEYEDIRIDAYLNKLKEKAKEKKFIIERVYNEDGSSKFILLKKELGKRDNKLITETVARLKFGLNEKDKRLPPFFSSIEFKNKTYKYNNDINHIIESANIESKNLMFSYSKNEYCIITSFTSNYAGPRVDGVKNILRDYFDKWERETNGHGDKLVINDQKLHMIIDFSSSGASSSGDTLVDSFQCSSNNKLNISLCDDVYKEILYSAITHSSTESDLEIYENNRLLDNLPTEHVSMIHNNIPEELSEYIPNEKYEHMIDLVKSRSNIRNKHEKYFSQNLKNLKDFIVELCKYDNDIARIVNSARKIDGRSLDSDEFIEKLNYNEITMIFKDNKKINSRRFNMFVSSLNILMEAKSLAIHSGAFPLKYKNGNVNTDLLLPNYKRKELDELLLVENKKIEDIEERVRKIDGTKAEIIDQIRILKQESSMCISRITNKIFESCPCLFGRVMVSDIISSVIFDKLNMKEISGKRINVKPIYFNEKDKSKALSINCSKDRVNAYAKLFFPEDGEQNKGFSDNKKIGESESEKIDNGNALGPRPKSPHEHKKRRQFTYKDTFEL